MTMFPKCDKCGSDKDGMRLSGANMSFFCRECQRVYAKAYRLRPEAAANQKVSLKKWRERHPEKAREIRRKFPKGFQILCHNCNFAKFKNGGVCPHQSEKVKVA